MTYRIIGRAEWGARHENGAGTRRLPASFVIVHHSVTIAPDLLPPFEDDYQAIRDLEAIGEARFGRGISYTRLFTPVGLIFEGHSIDRVGSHTAGYNVNGVGYCLVGNYETHHPTSAQLRAMAWCLKHDRANGWIDDAQIDFPHSDVKATACPGKYMRSAISTVNQLAAGPAITEEEDDMAAWSEEAAARATQAGVQAALHHRYEEGRNLADDEKQQTASLIALQGQLDHMIEAQVGTVNAINAVAERLDQVIARLPEPAESVQFSDERE